MLPEENVMARICATDMVWTNPQRPRIRNACSNTMFPGSVNFSGAKFGMRSDLRISRMWQEARDISVPFQVFAAPVWQRSPSSQAPRKGCIDNEVVHIQNAMGTRPARFRNGLCPTAIINQQFQSCSGLSGPCLKNLQFIGILLDRRLLCFRRGVNKDSMPWRLHCQLRAQSFQWNFSSHFLQDAPAFMYFHPSLSHCFSAQSL